MSKFLAAVLFFVLMFGISGCTNPVEDSTEDLTLFVLPHPDDEFQIWSKAEQSTGYLVFLTLTHGEQTTYCQAKGGKWTPQCSEARINSWVNFFKEVSQEMPNLPGDFGEPKTISLPGLDSTRDDNGKMVASKIATVWLDKDGRGALVAFDMGDGDLTQAEAKSAINYLLKEPLKFGLPDKTVKQLIGAYAYTGSVKGCAKYDHKDHVAVHNVLKNNDFNVENQIWSTCSLDPAENTSETLMVSDNLEKAIFTGPKPAFRENYGWLGGWKYTQDESELFHRKQAFARR